MSTFYDEAAMAHGADNPRWTVTFVENISGEERQEDVGATDYQQAINKATQRLNLDFTKPEGAYRFKHCIRAPSTSTNTAA